MIKKEFFDREVFLSKLEKRIAGLKENYRQNIAIIGEESIGKTAIIFKLLERFHDNYILILYVETRQETLSAFARRFTGTMLYNLLANSGIPLKENLDYLLLKSERYIPKTCEKIRLLLNALEKGRRNNILTDLLSLCESLHDETGKFCVVIMDEFHNLENFKIRTLYREWAKLLVAQRNTMYIIVSSRKFKTRELLSKDFSLLFGNFELMTVEPFDIKTSEDYLTAKLEEMKIATETSDFIVHFTGGNPLYLKIITDALLRTHTPELAEALEQLLIESSGVLNQRFSGYLGRILNTKLSTDYLTILYSIAGGRNKIKDIAHIMHKQKKEILSRINYLLEEDAITRNGDFLKITDRVFAFWLRFVYHQKQNSLAFDEQSQKEKFREGLAQMTKDFSLNCRKPLTERMTELLRLFEDEVLQIEKKKVRLNHFREVKYLELNRRGLNDCLICRSNESIWIIAIKPDSLCEEDILEFSKECKRYRHKSQRRIIVTLRDIDMNTRLRALEEKIWTWDLASLNQIMDYFAKPWVMV
jgi:Ni2+-binding GTPase involved in maturation of urease and hydrogenase